MSKPAGKYTPPVKVDTELWNEAPTEFTQRCVFMDIMGPESSGKTSLALSAPGPIGILDAMEKTEGVLQQFAGSKVIKRHRYGFVASTNIQDTQTRALPVWLNARKAYEGALDGWARSVVTDTTTNMWEMIRLARLGSLNPKGRTDSLYTPVNNEFRSLLAGKYRNQSRCNLITIHHMGDKWVNKSVNGQMQGFNTGKLERKGFKEIGYMAEVIIETYKDLEGVYHAVVRKGWFNGAAEGMDLTDEVLKALDLSGLNFPSIMAFITDTPEKEWAK